MICFGGLDSLHEPKSKQGNIWEDIASDIYIAILGWFFESN